MKASMDSAGGHHLLKHTAPSVERVVDCFDGAPVKEISKLIMRMGQRELQAKFNAVYGTVTRSNNNDWLRRKLFEAIGFKANSKSKIGTKRENKVGPAKSNRITKVANPTASRSSLSSPAHNQDSNAPYGMPPPESPATVTHGDHPQAGSSPFTPQMPWLPQFTGVHPVSSVSSESNLMSAHSGTLPAHYAVPRYNVFQPPPSAMPASGTPPGYGPVRIVYAPSNMRPPGHVLPSMVRAASSGNAAALPHSYPATYFMHPLGGYPQGPPHGAGAHLGPHPVSHSASMASLDMHSQSIPFPFPGPADDIPPRPAVTPGPYSGPAPATPGAVCSVPSTPPHHQFVPRCQGPDDAFTHSSDEEHSHMFPGMDCDTPGSIEQSRAGTGGKRPFRAPQRAQRIPVPMHARQEAGTAAAMAPAEPSNGASTAGDSTAEEQELLVDNMRFDGPPLEVLGCDVASTDDWDIIGAPSLATDFDCSTVDTTGSSGDEGGDLDIPGLSDGNGARAGHSTKERSVLLDEAIGSLLESSTSEGFGDAVAHVMRSMTRVGSCIVQWHHELETMR